MLQDFQFNSPGGFVFSPDGRYLYGSSYQTGVSNLFRFDLETNKLEALSNTRNRPVSPAPAGRWRAGGFRILCGRISPGKAASKAIEDVNAIPYLGQSVVEKYPELRSWRLPPRSSINDLELRTYAGVYQPWRNIELQSMYPIVQGYNTSPAGRHPFRFRGQPEPGAHHDDVFLLTGHDTLATRSVSRRFRGKLLGLASFRLFQQSRFLRLVRAHKSRSARIRSDRREAQESCL